MRSFPWTQATLSDPPSARLWRAVLVGVCILLIAPLLLVDVPPLADYPNHLARMVVLANPADPDLVRFYAPHWAIIPDLGIDIVVPPLLHLLPVHVAGRLVLAVIVLLPVLGTVAYSRAVFGRRSWWVLGVGLVAWNQAALLGFLNFTAGIGLGMLLAAAWIAWRERHPARTLALAFLGAIGLFFCHLMGLACFALLIGPYELTWLWCHRRQAILRLLSTAALFVVPLLLYAVSALGHMAGDMDFLPVPQKLAQLLVPFEGYVLPLDIATGVIVLATLLQGRPRATLASALTVALLALLYLAAPFDFQGVANFDTRFVVILGFLLFGALRPRLSRATGLLLAALFAVRMAVLATVWAGHASDLAQLRTAIAPVSPGSTVFLASVPVREAPAYWAHAPLGRRLSSGLRLDGHMAALLPIERRAWWPMLFDNDSQQPVTTREPYRALANRVGGEIDSDALPKVDLCGVDYVLLLEAGAIPDLDQFGNGRLSLLTRTDFAALFRVDQRKCGGT
ncbi:MAG: hypothetical protein P4L71_05860 [Acetobacteraceae bacterium]|nr:hypothetical protein [Acetobacteraceae bacterium]